jgi:glycosyltransferase involved in cell wall biosynthesis
MLVYDYFDPAYKAGGPISSCVNLVALLKEHLNFFVFTTNLDLDKQQLAVTTNRFIQYDTNVSIVYLDKKNSIKAFNNYIKLYAPDTIYLNGVFSMHSTLIPLLFLNFKKNNIKCVLSPRGMLQKNALKQKFLKKKIYLLIFNMLIKRLDVVWHTTSEIEKDDLVEIIPSAKKNMILTIGNIPNINILYRQKFQRTTSLRLVTAAIVSPMKNILKILLTLSKMTNNVIYTLYGPIKDQVYWKDCLNIVGKLPSNIKFQYKGSVNSKNIPGELCKHDVYIQPSESENFGHSIFEALMVGLPVITSKNTPWQTLSKNRAGWIVDPEIEYHLFSSINNAASLSDSEYIEFSVNARAEAEKYLVNSHLKESYLDLFNT